MTDAARPPAQRPLPLSRATVDRSGDRRTDEAWLEAAWADPATLVLRLVEGTAPVTGDPPRLALVAPAEVDDSAGRLLLGVEDGIAYFAVSEAGAGEAAAPEAVSEAAAPEAAAPEAGADEPHAAQPHAAQPQPAQPQPAQPDPVEAPAHDIAAVRWAGLREVGAALDDRDAGLLTHAVALSLWHASHPRCPQCGTVTEVAAAGAVRRCPEDGREHHPRTDPAVIMLITDDDDRALLGHHVGWPEGRFSTLAGFVEPGEPLEAAVVREVAEEVGVTVVDPRYVASQPWPFPSSLMLGFTARATGTEVRADGTEIAEARWFTREQLAADVRAGTVLLPPDVSIARRLIEDWFGGHLPDSP